MAFVISGFIFFTLAPNVYRAKLTGTEKLHLVGLAIVELLAFYLILSIPFAVRFFNLTLPLPSLTLMGSALLILLLYGAVQYLIVKKFFTKKDVKL